MSLETIVADLAMATEALHTAISAKKTVLDDAVRQAADTVTTLQAKRVAGEANATAAAATATQVTNDAAQIAAYKTAAAALDTATTATAAVTNLLPDMLAKKDPARHPFRKKMPTLVLDFERQRCHRYSPETGYGETPLNTFMTFTRASTATYTGPDGLIKTAAVNEPRYDYDPVTGECKGILIEEQRTNLLPLSDTFLAAGTWALAAGCFMYPSDKTSPTGQLRGVKLQSTGLEFTRLERDGVPATAGTSYSLTFILGRGTATHAHFTVEKSGISTMRAYVDLTALTCVVTKGSFTAASATAKSIGAFIAVTIVFTPSINDALAIFVGPSNGSTASVAGTTLYVYSAQLEVGAFPTSYIPTPATFTARASTATYLDANGVVQTAASGVARSNAYDYDSDGVLRPVGLLLESSATNRLLYSEQFDNAAWSKNLLGVATAPAVTANYGTSPDGATTADRVVFALNGGTTINDMSELVQYLTTVAGTTYTQSIWLKTTDASTKVVQLSFSGETPKLVTVTGTWQRFSNTGTASDTGRSFRLALRGTTGTSDSADLLVWGAQQEEGYYATSYIPTTSAQVTRAADTSTSAQATRVADDAKVDGTKFSDFYNQSQGTAVSEFSIAGLGGVYYPGVFSVDNGGVNDRFGYCVSDSDSDKVSLNVRVNAIYATPYFSDQGVTPNQTTKASVCVSRSGWAGAIKDTASVSSGSGKVIQSMTRLNIGKFDSWANGCIKNFIYYPQAFTNEELQAATSA